jgi:sterol desaturase/sphingolipid hydroxylase (fatty acid hydroxylase superfamily)
LGLAFLAGSLVEFLIPGPQRHSLKGRIRSIGFWSLYVLIGMTTAHLMQKGFQVSGIRPLFSIDLSQAQTSTNFAVALLGLTILPFGSLFVTDGFFYWFHRAQHAIPFLWRFHRVHHSIEELNAVNHYSHFAEEIFKFPLQILPMLLLVQLSLPETLVASWLITVANGILHSNSAISYGPFKWLWSEPRFHRIHHSIEERHWNRNFAAFFPVWDVLFQTAYWPKRSEFPATGLSDLKEPARLSDYLAATANPSPPLVRIERGIEI